MPPALQMLQDLLGDSSSEDDDVSKPESGEGHPIDSTPSVLVVVIVVI